MYNILQNNQETYNESFILICLILAVFRIYLEVINFDFSTLPITKSIGDKMGTSASQNIHKAGLFFSTGYIVLFAPYFFIS